MNTKGLPYVVPICNLARLIRPCFVNNPLRRPHIGFCHSALESSFCIPREGNSRRDSVLLLVPRVS